MKPICKLDNIKLDIDLCNYSKQGSGDHTEKFLYMKSQITNTVLYSHHFNIKSKYIRLLINKEKKSIKI